MVEAHYSQPYVRSSRTVLLVNLLLLRPLSHRDHLMLGGSGTPHPGTSRATKISLVTIHQRQRQNLGQSLERDLHPSRQVLHHLSTQLQG